MPLVPPVTSTRLPEKSINDSTLGACAEYGRYTLRMNQPTTRPGETTGEPLFRAVSLLLTDLCTLRFEGLVQGGVDPLEAAERVMEGLSRYNFLNDVNGANYPALKREIEMAVSTMAGRITEEENPR